MQMNVGEYLVAVKKISDANNSIKNSCKLSSVSFGSCSGESITNINAAISNLETQILAYCECVEKDIQKLHQVHINYLNADYQSDVTRGGAKNDTH